MGILALLAASVLAQAQPPTVYVNGNIYTMDATRPRVEAT